MKSLIFFALVFFSLASQAQVEVGIAAGYRSNQIDTDLRNANTSSVGGMQFGPIFHFPITDLWGLRSGFLYTRRSAWIDNTASGTVDIQYAYFDVPVTAQLRFSDLAGVFGGFVVGFNQSKDVSCSRTQCAAADMRSVILPWQVGLNFRLISSLGGELFYEYVPGDLSANVQNMRSVGANLIYYFE